MKDKLLLSVAAMVLAGATLACGVVNNLVDRAVEEAGEVVVEQIEEQTGEELPDLDAMQATADAALDDLDEVEGAEGVEAVIPEGFVDSGASGFPMIEGGSVLLEDENNIQYTIEGVTMAEALQFYRDTFTAQGLTERDVTTVIQDAYASMVFDGDASGNAVVVQIVDLGDGTLTISLTRSLV